MRKACRLVLWLSIAVSLAGVVASPAAAADDAFYLRDGERVVFFGDSITQSGQYVEYVEAFLRTRFPDRTIAIVNHGISSETVSGTTEADHVPPRPDAHRRFDRDVAAWKPDVLVACFGMNDGNYHPFGAERFERYQAGVRRLLERGASAGARAATLLTPPPFDPYRRTAGDPAATSFGYKFAAIDYDHTLTEYSRFVVSLAEEDGGPLVADVHTAMNEHLARRRESRVSFTLSPDAVHPDPTGHWLMAQTLLLAWHAPAECATAEIDAAALAVRQGDAGELARDGDGLRFAWTTPLPMPLDPRWDAESLALEAVAERLNRHRLVIAGLSADRYRLLADGQDIGEFSRDQLADGIDLTALPALPTNRRAAEVLALVQERSQAIYSAWRKTIAAPDDEGVKSEQVAADRRAEEMDSQLRELCRPLRMELRLDPVVTGAQ